MVRKIDIGAAPILWSNVKYAFDIVNDNLQELQNAIGLNTLEFNADIIPKDDNTYTLGTELYRWSSVYSEDIYTSKISFDNFNLSVINGELTVTDNSGNNLPTKLTLAFKEIDVVGQPLLTAGYNDRLTIEHGIGIEIIANRPSNTLYINNAGIINLVPNNEISVVTNSITKDTDIILNNPNKFNMINVAGDLLTATSSTDTVTLDEGYGVILTANNINNSITISVNPEIDIYGSVIGADGVILVDTNNNTINGSFFGNLTGDVLSSTGFTLINHANETFTGNVYGSIFADDSTILVNADAGIFTGTLYGSVFADDSTILVDAENGTISWYVISDAPLFVEKTSDTGSAIIPSGTEAERDVSPAPGFIRFNTSRTVFEGYNGHAWVPFDKDQEIVIDFATPGTYAVDMFSGDVFQSAEYKIQGKSAEGVQFSTVAIVFGGDPTSTVYTEYGLIQSHGVEIANYFINTDINNNITLFCNVLYSNTKIIFKKHTLSNSGETYIRYDFNFGTGIINLNEGDGTIDLNT